jgi:RNA polymerase sigma-70 factor (ECF subfamily)
VDTQDAQEHSPHPEPQATPGTLGAVLYARRARPLVPESEWHALVLGVAAGRESALHDLYDRSHRMVYTLAVRITCDRATAEEATLDVFHDVWRRAGRYDPANGTVLGWIMNQARSRAIDRIRFEHRMKRVDTRVDEDVTIAHVDGPEELLELKQRGEALRRALSALTIDERRAVESAFFAELTHAEIAERWEEPLGTVKTRIRTALRKLRRTLGSKEDA